jgi:hypothetical protein
MAPTVWTETMVGSAAVCWVCNLAGAEFFYYMKMDDKNKIDPFVSAFVDSTFVGMQALIRSGQEIAPQIIMFGRNGVRPAIMPLMGVGAFFVSKEGKRKLPAVVKKAWKAIHLTSRGSS